MHRLDASAADPELISLTRDCLAADRQQRPRDAGIVSARITAYLSGVQDRLRKADLARVEAQARAEEERKRRRITVALAASVLLTACVVGGGWSYLARQQQRRAAQVDLALREAELRRDDAERTGDDLTRWLAARDAAQAVVSLVADARDAATRDRVTALLQQVEQEARRAEDDQKLLDKLVDIRSTEADDGDGSDSDVAYGDAFRGAGIDVDKLAPAEVGACIKKRPASVALALAGALDDWAVQRRRAYPKKEEAWERLVSVAQAADPDPMRGRVRELWLQPDSKAQLEALRRLAKEADEETWPAQSMRLLAIAAGKAGDQGAAVAVLRRAESRHPGDLWINYNLALALENARPPQTEEAIRFYSVARGLRPETAHELAHALQNRGQGEEALAIFRDLVRLRPNNGSHRACYANLLKDRGNQNVARDQIDRAVADLEVLNRLKTGQRGVHFALGNAMNYQGKADEAIAEYRIVIDLKPDDVGAHLNLGAALYGQGKVEEAIAEFRTAIRVDPGHFLAHNNLGVALSIQGKVEEAIAEYHAAIRLNPDHHYAHNNLAKTLHDQGKFDAAIAELRTAIRLKPDYSEAHGNLGSALGDQGKLDEAIAEYRTAIRLKPDWADPHSNLGGALQDQGKLNEAIAEYHTALRLKPDDAKVHYNFGHALQKQRKLDEAIAEYRAAIRLKLEFAGAHNNLGAALQDQGKLDEAIAEFRTAIRLKPDYSEAHGNLGSALGDQGKLDEAIAEYRTAICLNPDYADVHNNLGNALSYQGKLDGAIAEYRTALRLKPDDADAHYNLGRALRGQGKLDEAITEYREALRLRPPYAEAHCNLGLVFQDKGQFREALGELRRGHELGSKRTGWSYPSDQWVLRAEQLVKLESKLPMILIGQDQRASATEGVQLGYMSYNQKHFAGSARLFANAFQADPKLSDDMKAQNRYNAACAAALAGCGQGKDEAPLHHAAKDRWRKQAIDWLKADLAAWTKAVETGPTQARQLVVQTLQHWRADPDLAGIRDEVSLAKLHEAERKACRAALG